MFDLQEWQNTRFVAQDVLEIRGNKYVLVSTVKLPIDHGWNGRSLWYETMIFDCDAEGHIPSPALGSFDHFQTRYETKEEAQTGHDWLVQAVLHWDDKWDVIENQWRNR